MSNDSPITFPCPACGIKLTIPGALAGVVGPCPTCRTQIQAPYPAPVPALGPAPAQPPIHPAPPYQPPAAPVQTAPHATGQVPHQAEAPRPPHESAPLPPAAHPYPPTAQAIPPVSAPPSSPQPHPAPQVYQAPQVQMDPAPVAPTQVPLSYEAPPLPPPVTAASEQPVAGNPAVLRPEPRQLPSRTSQAEVVAKQMPEPGTGGGSSKKSHALPRHPRRKGPLARVMMLVLFLLASGALVYGVLTILRNQAADSAPPKSGGTPPAISIVPTSPPGDSPPSKAAGIPVLPVPEPDQPVIMEPVPDLPEGIEPATPGAQAREVLMKFLAATTLEERLPLMETKTSAPELAASCLSGPLPQTNSVLIDAMENNAIEQVSDLYHLVDFEGENGQTTPCTILVRIRGTSPPKVVADPFLDTFGGRLAAFAKAPSTKSGYFQVIISALASCYDERVPNREKKLTLKLLARDNSKEIASAYFGRQSKIGAMLEDGTYSLSYGKAKACTVMLRWNTEDDSERPYLEALDFKTLDWNP